MSSISANNNVNSTTSGTTSSTSSSSSSSSSTSIVDSISAATPLSLDLSASSSSSISLTPPSVSLIEFARIVNGATVASLTQTNAFQVQQSDLFENLWLEAGAYAAAVLKRSTELKNEAESEINLYQNVVSSELNFNYYSVTPYNNALDEGTALTGQMYNAQEQYLADPATYTDAQYNTQVGQYNANVGSVNANIQAAFDTYVAAANAYNEQALQNNIQINFINLSRAALNIITTIPPQPLIQVPTSPPLLPTNLPTVPPPITATTVPASLTDVTPVDVNPEVSTAINVAPVNSQEQALLDSIQSSLNNIYTSSAVNYNNAWVTSSASVTNMQNALLAYQAIDPVTQASTDAYNAAVSTYLAAAQAANPQLASLGQSYIDAINQYNSSLASINTQINAFNTIRAQNNEELILNQTAIPVPTLASLELPTDIALGPPPPTTSSITSAPRPLLPPTPDGSNSPTNTTGYVNTYLFTNLVTYISNLQYYTNNLTTLEQYVKQLLSASSVKVNELLPHNAYKDRYASAALNIPSNGAVGGISLTAMGTGLTNKSLGAVITNAFFISALNQAQYTAQQNQVIGNAVYFSVHALQTAAIQASLPTIGQLSSTPDAFGTQAASTVLATNYLSAINGVVNSGSVSKAVASSLSSAGYSSDEIATLLGPLSASVNAGLVNSGLLAVSSSLQLPGLTPQLLGTLDNGSLQPQVAAAAAKNFGSAFNNPVVSQELTLSLSKSLEDQGVGASANVGSLVTNTLRTPSNLTSANAFYSALQQNALNQGYDPSTATALATKAVSFINTELALPYLDTKFQASAITPAVLQSNSLDNPNFTNALNNSLANNDYISNRTFRDALVAELEKQPGASSQTASDQANTLLAAITPGTQTFSAGSVNSDLLISSLSPAGSAAATSIVSALSNSTFSSEAEYRDTLSNQLQLNNVSKETADRLAQKAAITVSSNNPLAINNSNFLSQSEVLDQLKSQTQERLKGTLGDSLANTVATNLREATSQATATLEKSVKDTKTLYDQKSDDEKVDVFSNSVSPLWDNYALNERIMDPANSLVLTGSWSLYLQGASNTPKHGKHDIDIQV